MIVANTAPRGAPTPSLRFPAMITSRSHFLLSTCFATAALALAASPFALHAADAPPAGFTSLWNGKDLEGWYGWGTTDPRTLACLTPEQHAEYRTRYAP